MEQDKKLNVDEKVIIEWTPDKMIGVVCFEKAIGEGKSLEEREIREAIHSRGIKEGIDEDAMCTLLRERKYGYKYIVAKGAPPQKGEDAKIKFFFDLESINQLKPKQRKDGSVDFKDLDIIKNVKKDTQLAVKVEGTKGIDGVNILGEVLRSQAGRDVRLPRGKNTRLLEDGLTIVADIDGRICYDGHNIYLSPTFIVEKDVDSSTGNIDFIGNVIVNGNVQSGYKVTATGTVEVKGSVEAAEILSESDVIVWYGIQGMDKGYIRAKGNVIAKFIQNAHVEAEGDVIAECIMHSQVGATKIDVSKGKGLIVGGEIIAASLIQAIHIGSHMATHTSLQIGISPEMTKAYQDAKEEMIKQKEELSQISKSISFLMRKKDVLGEEKKMLLNKLLTTKLQVEADYKKASTTYKELSNKMMTINQGSIKIKDKLYPGVKITMGTLIKYIHEDYTYCTIQKEGADIKILPY